MNSLGRWMAAASNLVLGMGTLVAQTLDLPTSKQLIGEIPGHPQRLNSLPMSIAVSPDNRYVVTLNAGYGTAESKYEQSLAVLDTQTGKLKDFPDDRTLVGARQTLYSWLAFSRDGSHLYASMGSLRTPEGDGEKGVPFPAAIALVQEKKGGDRLLVADNLSDDVLLIDPATGAIEKRFDLSESNTVPSTYPIALVVPRGGGRGLG